LYAEFIKTVSAAPPEIAAALPAFDNTYSRVVKHFEPPPV
jgi:hypothetical protein